jgi:hypothetical protein
MPGAAYGGHSNIRAHRCVPSLVGITPSYRARAEVRVLLPLAYLGNDQGRTGGGRVRTPVVASQPAWIALLTNVLLNMDRAAEISEAVRSPNF